MYLEPDQTRTNEKVKKKRKNIPGLVVRIPKIQHWFDVFFNELIIDVLSVGVYQVTNVIEHRDFDWLDELISFLDSIIYWIQSFDLEAVVSQHELLLQRSNNYVNKWKRVHYWTTEKTFLNLAYVLHLKLTLGQLHFFC